MDAGAHRLLEATIHKTLHSQGFSRSSSQASLVFTDLLSRYLALLTSTCSKYAEHAGRTGLTPRDALSALDELGVNVEDLGEYCVSEGHELRRYNVHTVQTLTELQKFKAQLAEGLQKDLDDAITLIYTPVSEDLHSDESEEEGNEEDGSMNMDECGGVDDVETLRPLDEHMSHPRKDAVLSTPALPLSPISNPSSPSRKRARTAKWRAPSHVPDFLPPFPLDDSTTDGPIAPQTQHIPPVQPPLLRIDKPPSPMPQMLTPTTASDFLTQVPYSQSTLATTSTWHVPSSLPPQPPHANARPQRLPTPQTEQALLEAYHHILTHPPPPIPTAPNPSRHKVAMALLYQTQWNPRWEPPDTLYSSIAPCGPRVAYIGPTFPVELGNSMPTPGETRMKEEEKARIMPPAQPRSVSSMERLTPLISQQSSRIPDLARCVLPGTVFTRATKLHHPGVLSRGEKQLFYGGGIDAPWNVNTTASALSVLSKDKDALLTNGKGKEVAGKPILQDARLYATWDYEQKSFKDTLVVGRRGRPGSTQGVGMIGIGNGPKTRGESKLG